MVIFSGARLVSVSFLTVSPATHPVRTLIFSLPIVILALVSLRFLGNVNSGSTIIYHPRDIFRPIQIYSGHKKLSSSQKKHGYICSYNGPCSSAFLGLVSFAAAEFLLVTLFLEADYLFAVI